jgi:Tol biopolymer transport system component
VFVRDQGAGVTSLLSVGAAGKANGSSGDPVISADGRYVAFWSEASNLVPGDTNQRGDVFVRDRLAGVTRRVSVTSTGQQTSGTYSEVPPAISATGRYIAFFSNASNLVPGDTNGAGDVFVRDRLAGLTRRVSVGAAGQANDNSAEPAISADGRYVAFYSEASNLVPGDTNTTVDVFVRDRLSGVTRRISVSTAGQGNGPSYGPSLTPDGRSVAFESDASNLVPGDTNQRGDVFVWGPPSGTVVRRHVRPKFWRTS